MGGGTFDLTILDLAGDVFEVMSTAGDTFLGGDDIDLLISERMADAFLAHHRFDPRQDPQAYERLRAAAEWSKCQLSTEEDVHLRVEELAYGAGGASLDLTFSLTRASLEENIRPLIARTFDVCEQAMKIAKIRPTQLDNVILVGGSTRIPIVRQMVAEYFGREPLGTIDPDLVVAEGAAMQGWALRETARTSSAPLARVALKRVTQSELKTAKRAPEADGKPAGPAFAPRNQGAPVEVPSPRRDLREEEPWDETDDSSIDEIPGELTTPHVPRAVLPPAPPKSVVSAPIKPVASASEPPSVPSRDPSRPPLLLDVTPHSLGVETVNGFCEHVIKRNAAIPVEQMRVFSTATDMQDSVRVSIVQGESRRLEDNQPLGEIVLSGLRQAPRGVVKIGVTFMMDADGTLGVRATDLETGREQVIRIQLVGSMSEAEIESLTARQQQMLG
jgi:molecular chaperone DnaK (HSP70)